MPTLEFKGKPFVYSHHLSVPFRELKIDAAKSLPGPSGPGLDDNLVIHGDNLESLKALLPRYAGKVDVVYIDPPYNTGNEGWAYNDNVNAPAMKEWLGKVVDAEDMERHDKWLSMMWPRMQLLKDLLADDGLIAVSIGNDEFHTLRLLLDEVFGTDKFVATLSWKSRAKPSNIGTAKAKPQGDAEFILIYCKADYPKFNLVVSGRARSYPHDDEDGNFRLQTILKSGRGTNKRDTMRFRINGYTPPEGQRWQGGEDYIQDLFRRNRAGFFDGTPMLKYYEHEEAEEGSPFWCYVAREESGTAESGKNTLNLILGNDHGMDTVKPVEVINYVLTRASRPDSLILDSFAGSGTTAHAVLALNKADGGHRRFILIETEDYADALTAERIRRVIEGVPGAKEETLKSGLGGTFTFSELGEAMDLERLFAGGAEAPAWSRVAEYVAYTATGATLVADEPGPDWLAGEVAGYRLHLIYKPDASWMQSNDAMLSLDVAERIAKAAAGKPVLVFAAGKFMGLKVLTALGVTFCQLPYSIHRILGDGSEGLAGVDAA
jgi:adenine-specific DNA-methyltransferase